MDSKIVKLQIVSKEFTVLQHFVSIIHHLGGEILNWVSTAMLILIDFHYSGIQLGRRDFAPLPLAITEVPMGLSLYMMLLTR